MHEDPSADLVIRATLCSRLDMLRERAGRLSCGAIATEIDAIRMLAVHHRLRAVERVCSGFTRALAEDGRGALVGGWFAAIADAVGCRAAEEERAAEACVAAVMVRFG